MACNSRNSAVVAAHTRMSPEIRERISVVHRSILESITLNVDRQCVQVTAVHHGQIFVEVIPRIDGLCQQDRLAQHALQIVNLDTCQNGPANRCAIGVVLFVDELQGTAAEFDSVDVMGVYRIEDFAGKLCAFILFGRSFHLPTVGNFIVSSQKIIARSIHSVMQLLSGRSSQRFKH